jgi:hypothetical protein
MVDEQRRLLLHEQKHAVTPENSIKTRRPHQTAKERASKTYHTESSVFLAQLGVLGVHTSEVILQLFVERGQFTVGLLEVFDLDFLIGMRGL